MTDTDEKYADNPAAAQAYETLNTEWKRVSRLLAADCTVHVPAFAIRAALVNNMAEVAELVRRWQDYVEATKPPPIEPIPEHAYFSFARNLFYNRYTDAPLGTFFYRKWHDRRNEFPTMPSLEPSRKEAWAGHSTSCRARATNVLANCTCAADREQEQPSIEPIPHHLAIAEDTPKKDKA